MKLFTTRPDIQNAESFGQLLQVFLVSIQRSEYEHVLAKYGLTEIDADTWYPMALILEIFESIQKDTNAMQNLVSIGIKVSEVIDFKSRCPTFKDFMDILPIIEHEVHRNNPSEFKTKLIEAHCFEVIDRTVWPHDLLYGMLYGVAGLYHSEHDYHVERVKIELDPETGDEIGIYHITW